MDLCRRRHRVPGDSSRRSRVFVDIPRQQSIKSIKTGLLNTESIDNKFTVVADCITRNDFNITEVPSTTTEPRHPGLRIGSFNTDSVCDILATYGLDVLALRETRHERTDSVSLRRASPPGYSVLEEARPLVKNRLKKFVVDQVAFVYRSNFKMAKTSTLPNVKIFEFLCCRLNTGRGGAVVVASVYRPGSDVVTPSSLRSLTVL